MEVKKITKILVFFISIEFILLTFPLLFPRNPSLTGNKKKGIR
jgi:hypothetical protein